MSDIAEKLLAAIDAEESAADSVARSRIIRQRVGGTYKEFAPRNEERYQAILRHCAADREILALHKPDEHDGLCGTCGLDGQNLDCTYPCDTLRILARGYGVTP